MKRKFTLTQISRLLDSSPATIVYWKKNSYRYGKRLPFNRLEEQTLKGILKAMGLCSNTSKILVLFVFDTYKQYYDLQNKTDQTFLKLEGSLKDSVHNTLERKNLVLSKLKSNRYNRLFGDILSYKYKQIYIVDYTKNRIFSILMRVILSYLGIEVILIE